MPRAAAPRERETVVTRHRRRRLRARRLAAAAGRLCASAALLAACGPPPNDPARDATARDVAGDASATREAAVRRPRPARYQLVVAPGPDPASPARVRILDQPSGRELGAIADALGGDARGYGANVAACDLDGDGVDEIVVGPGAAPDADSRVRRYHADGTSAGPDIGPVYDEGVGFGVELACGDLDGDGADEIITAPGPAPVASATIRAFRADGTRVLAFEAYDEGTLGGARVAAGDLDGDGFDEIVTAPGAAESNPATIKVFDRAGVERNRFDAFAPPARSGARVATADVDGDGRREIVVAPGPAALAPAEVRIFRASGEMLNSFRAPDPAPHIASYGYYHVHDPAFGLNIPNAAGFTNWAHLWDPQYLPVAREHQMRAVLELNLANDETTWPARVADLAARVGANRDVLAAVLVVDEPEYRPWNTAKQRRAVALAQQTFPGIPTVINYNSRQVPPDNVDWISVDPYMPPGFDNSGCTDRATFDGAIRLLDWAASQGKPVVLIPPSFERTTPSVWELPSLCQQGWYMEAALAQPAVVGVLWFMFGNAVAGMSAGETIRGAGAFPDVLALHRTFWDSVRYGGWGARLSAGDFDGDGRDEIVVGRGEGRGNAAALQVFRADGTAQGPPVTAFPMARYGVAVAVQRLAH